jgi:hypothetical protein
MQAWLIHPTNLLCNRSGPKTTHARWLKFDLAKVVRAGLIRLHGALLAAKVVPFVADKICLCVWLLVCWLG